MDNPTLSLLEQQIERLIAHCQELERANEQLRERDRQWRNERMRLVQQRDATRAKVEAMISRLKAMEQA